MRSSRLLLPLFLVFALLVAQYGAYAHGISHTIAEQTQDQSVPHDKHCDLCAAYAQIGGAISVSLVHFDFSSSFEETLATYSTSFHSIASPRSRRARLLTPFKALSTPRSGSRGFVSFLE